MTDAEDDDGKMTTDDNAYRLPKVQGSRVAFFRKRAGLSQDELSQMAGMTAAVGRIERSSASGSSYSPTQVAIEQIAKALEVAPVNFYNPADIQKFTAGQIPPHDLVGCEDNSDEGNGNAHLATRTLDASDCERIRLFPKNLHGQRFQLRFVNGISRPWWPVPATKAEILGLETGHSIEQYAEVRRDDKKLGNYDVFAEGGLATAMVDLAPRAEVEVCVRAVFAVQLDSRAGYGWVREEERVYETVFGFCVEEIL